MILIIDGMPKVGKTTLASHLCHDLSLQFVGVERFDLLAAGDDWEQQMLDLIHLSQEESVRMIFDGGLVLARFHDPRRDFSYLDALLTNAYAFLLCLTESPITIYRRMLEANSSRIHYSRREIIEGHTRCLGEFRASQIDPKGSFVANQFLIRETKVKDMFVKTDHYESVISIIKQKWTNG